MLNLSLFLIINTAWALSPTSDENLPGQLQSNSAQCTHQEHNDICTYLGNATFSQGITKLQAEQITLDRTGNKINKMVATGKHSNYVTATENEPLNVTADLMTIDYQKNIIILKNNAQLTKGVTKLQAKQITIYRVVNKINKIVASGKHSSYSSITDNQQPVDAIADLITIDYNNNKMILENNELLTIGQDKYRGPYVEYKFD